MAGLEAMMQAGGAGKGPGFRKEGLREKTRDCKLGLRAVGTGIPATRDMYTLIPKS